MRVMAAQGCGSRAMGSCQVWKPAEQVLQFLSNCPAARSCIWDDESVVTNVDLEKAKPIVKRAAPAVWKPPPQLQINSSNFDVNDGSGIQEKGSPAFFHKDGGREAEIVQSSNMGPDEQSVIMSDQETFIDNGRDVQNNTGNLTSSEKSSMQSNLAARNNLESFHGNHIKKTQASGSFLEEFHVGTEGPSDSMEPHMGTSDFPDSSRIENPIPYLKTRSLSFFYEDLSHKDGDISNMAGPSYQEENQFDQVTQQLLDKKDISLHPVPKEDAHVWQKAVAGSQDGHVELPGMFYSSGLNGDLEDILKKNIAADQGSGVPNQDAKINGKLQPSHASKTVSLNALMAPASTSLENDNLQKDAYIGIPVNANVMYSEGFARMPSKSKQVNILEAGENCHDESRDFPSIKIIKKGAGNLDNQGSSMGSSASTEHVPLCKRPHGSQDGRPSIPPLLWKLKPVSKRRSHSHHAAPQENPDFDNRVECTPSVLESTKYSARSEEYDKFLPEDKTSISLKEQKSVHKHSKKLAVREDRNLPRDDYNVIQKEGRKPADLAGKKSALKEERKVSQAEDRKSFGREHKKLIHSEDKKMLHGEGKLVWRPGQKLAQREEKKIIQREDINLSRKAGNSTFFREGTKLVLKEEKKMVPKDDTRPNQKADRKLSQKEGKCILQRDEKIMLQKEDLKSHSRSKAETIASGSRNIIQERGKVIITKKPVGSEKSKKYSRALDMLMNAIQVASGTTAAKAKAKNLSDIKPMEQGAKVNPSVTKKRTPIFVHLGVPIIQKKATRNTKSAFKRKQIPSKDTVVKMPTKKRSASHADVHARSKRRLVQDHHDAEEFIDPQTHERTHALHSRFLDSVVNSSKESMADEMMI